MRFFFSLLCFFAAGEQTLFDGRTLSGWTWSIDAMPPAPAWNAEAGVLKTTPGQGQPVYLLTRESFSDFDFSFEWRAEAGANSGIKYRFQGYWSDGKHFDEPVGPGRIEPIGLEYQITDDERHADALSAGSHSTAAIYEYWPAKKPGPARANVWHTGRIVARGTHIEHWLDGGKVVDLDLASPEVQAAFARSKRKGSSPLLARQERRQSPLALQFHDGVVEFRNLKLRRL